MKKLNSLLLLLILSSCISTKSTIKNIDNTAKRPKMEASFLLLTEYATDSNYGYNEDYPINIGFLTENYAEVQVKAYLNALVQKDGSKIEFKRIDDCCPFPTKTNSLGVGTLWVYEFYLKNDSKPKNLYINIYERGEIVCPKGLLINPEVTNVTEANKQKQ